MIDRHEGFHQFGAGWERYGSFEVFKSEDDGQFYWWPCYPACLPDGDPTGPFATAKDAYEDARFGGESGASEAGQGSVSPPAG